MQISQLPLAALLTAGLLTLAACGGSGDSAMAPETPPPPTPTPAPVDLDITGAMDIAPGTLELGAGETAVRGNVTFSCPADAGDAGCSIAVADSLGQLIAQATGGATAMVAPPSTPPTPPTPPDPAQPTDVELPSSASLTDVGLSESSPGDEAPVDLDAEESIVRGDVTYTCPASAGAEGCTLTFANTAGGLTATQIGGVTAVQNPPGSGGVSPPAATGPGGDSGVTVTAERVGDADAVTYTATLDSRASVMDAETTLDTSLSGLADGWAGADGESVDLEPRSSANDMMLRARVVSNIGPDTTRSFFAKHPAAGGMEDAETPADDDRYIVAAENTEYFGTTGITLAGTGSTASGDYDGITGVFTCYSGPCGIEYDQGTDTDADATDDDTVTITGRVHFEPNLVADAIPTFQDVEDADYLRLAAWIVETNGDAESTGVNVYAKQALTADGLSLLDRRGGTAEEEFTYSGQSIGVYYKETAAMPDAEPAVAAVGTAAFFEATATFTATFAPAGDKISGGLSDFISSDATNAPLTNYRLDFAEASLSGGAASGLWRRVTTLAMSITGLSIRRTSKAIGCSTSLVTGHLSLARSVLSEDATPPIRSSSSGELSGPPKSSSLGCNMRKPRSEALSGNGWGRPSGRPFFVCQA